MRAGGVERLTALVQPRQSGADVLAGEERTAGPVTDPGREGLDAGPQPHDTAALAQVRAQGLGHDGAARDPGDERRLHREDAVDHDRLEHVQGVAAEGRLQLRCRRARQLGDHRVVVDVGPARALGEREPDRGLARPHHPDEQHPDRAGRPAHAGENCTTTLMSSGPRSKASWIRSGATRRLTNRSSHSRKPSR